MQLTPRLAPSAQLIISVIIGLVLLCGLGFLIKSNLQGSLPTPSTSVGAPANTETGANWIRLSGWDISFQFPAGWHLVPSYVGDEPMPKRSVTSADSSVTFQDSAETIYRGETNPPPAPFTENYAAIDVDRLPDGYTIPTPNTTVRYGGVHIIDWSEPASDVGVGTNEYLFYQGTNALYRISFSESGDGFTSAQFHQVISTLREEP